MVPLFPMYMICLFAVSTYRAKSGTGCNELAHMQICESRSTTTGAWQLRESTQGPLVDGFLSGRTPIPLQGCAFIEACIEATGMSAVCELVWVLTRGTPHGVTSTARVRLPRRDVVQTGWVGRDGS